MSKVRIQCTKERRELTALVTLKIAVIRDVVFKQAYTIWMSQRMPSISLKTKLADGQESSRDFHFTCPATKEYPPECPARHLFRIRSNGKAPFLPRRSSAQAKKP